MKRTVNHFSDELKLKVVQEYLQTDQSRQQIMQKYNIRGGGCISNWMRKFGLSYPTEEQIKVNNQVSKESRKTPQERELEQKLKTLEQELEHEKLRTKALNTLKDIAEEELKISIRKKSGNRSRL